MAKWLSYHLYFFSFSFGLTIRKEYRKVSHDKCHMSYHMSGSHSVVLHDKSHDECGKVVHRLCSDCISSIQEMEENSIELSLSTQTWSVIKLSQAKSLQLLSEFIANCVNSCVNLTISDRLDRYKTLLLL